MALHVAAPKLEMTAARALRRSEAEEGKVFYYDMAGARWGHKTPFGTNRLSARDDHSLALWGAKIVAFGGRAEIGRAHV